MHTILELLNGHFHLCPQDVAQFTVIWDQIKLGFSLLRFW